MLLIMEAIWTEEVYSLQFSSFQDIQKKNPIYCVYYISLLHGNDRDGIYLAKELQ